MFMKPYITTEIFIDRAKDIHGERYCYKKTIYVSSKNNLKITCEKHGDFIQLAANHLRGHGCPQCGIEKNKRPDYIPSIDDFLNKSFKRHGDRYLYDRVVYQGVDVKVEIGCKKHGYFFLKPKLHTSRLGRGCPKCSKEKMSKNLATDNKYFKELCVEVHGDKYDYSKTVFINYKTKILVGCRIHGDFYTSPYTHVKKKSDCPTCAAISRQNKITRGILKSRFNKIVQPEKYKLVPVGDDYVSKVSNEDFIYVKDILWTISNGYAVSSSNNISLHRFINKTPDNLVTDHINRDRLDNRRCNLRSCTEAQNNANRELVKNTSSKYKGVSYNKKSGKWRACVSFKGNGVFGLFDTEKEAALFYNENAILLHKEFAVLNIIKD